MVPRRRLFGSTQQKVLELLFGQPQRRFFVTQIMNLARSGCGAVQRELRRLESVQMHGNQKHRQANRESPLYDEISSVVRKTAGLERSLRTATGSMPGTVHLALIYGSVTKGTDTSASAIDLLIVADDLMLEDVYAAFSPVEDLPDRRVKSTIYTREELNRRRSHGNPFLKCLLGGPGQYCRERSMPNDELEILIRIGQLGAALVTRSEIASLARSGTVRLKDAKCETLS